MAFSYEVTDKTIFGNKRVMLGYYINSTAGDTGGAIDTGLDQVQYVTFTPATVTTTPPRLSSTTLPTTSGSITLATGAGDDGYFMAIGL